MSNLTSLPIWQKLGAEKQKIANHKISALLENEPERVKNFSLEAAGLFLDYSKNLLSTTALQHLVELAQACKLQEKIEAMFNGVVINTTEKRPVLHTALRNQNRNAVLNINGENVIAAVHATLDKMEHCTQQIRDGKWHGFSGKPITAIVNIGIGGSDLGPAMVTEALLPYASNELNCYFVSNVDSSHISETLKKLNPETTLFIISSKTFTTQETLCNARTAKEWVLSNATNNKDVIKKHFLGVTAKPERAIEFGIDADNVYPFWDWVGGRFSLWSAIGLSIAISIGMENFRLLLQGAQAMDEHFRTAPFNANMPTLLALIGIWNINFLGAQNQAIIPYDQYLQLFPAYLQQLEMESNGKSIAITGDAVDYATAPIIWGSVGTNGQHAFHQLLMQGKVFVPVDFILPLTSHNPIGDHHWLLVANCLAQSQALMRGKNLSEVEEELKAQGLKQDEISKLAPHKVIAGNQPNNMLLLPKLTPKTLGALIALYEHKVFVQGVIWNINSFDQWGVELGKKLSDKILPALKGYKTSAEHFDASTKNLIKKYLQANE